eukprot:symbB.v1.2.001522.t2/scaffold83.1/size345278/6
MAYKYLSVAFLQMIKEGNIINIYIMAYFAGLETFSYTQVAILVVMLTATMSCVEGELNFSLIGFIVQGSASFCEAAKTIFQALVLNGKGQKLDPLSTVLVIMPMSGLLLGGVLLFNNLVVDVGFAAQPSWEEIYRYRYFLTLNILNAFALNVAIAVFLKYLSPVSYILTGNIKDIVVVCMGAWIIGERISLTQATGFTMQVLCVFAWTTYKQYGSLVPKMVYETETETQQSAKASLAPSVLVKVLEVIADKPLDVIMEERICGPLKMRDTGFKVSKEQAGRIGPWYKSVEVDGKSREAHCLEVVDPGGENSGWVGDNAAKVLSAGGTVDVPLKMRGGMVSTFNDYLRFLIMIRNFGELDGVRVLNRETVQMMICNHIPVACYGKKTVFVFDKPGVGYNCLGQIQAQHPKQDRELTPFLGVMPVWRTVTTMDDLVKLLEQHETQMQDLLAGISACCLGSETAIMLSLPRASFSPNVVALEGRSTRRGLRRCDFLDGRWMQIGGASCVASYVAGIGKRGRRKVATTLAARSPDVAEATPKGGATVVISGGSQGVGRATALKFAQAGYNVVLAARNEEALREAEKLCLDAVQPGRAVLAVSCDITSPESIEELQQRVASQFTDLRVVVCNAGVCMTGDFLSHSLDDFASQMNVNFLGHVSTVRAFLPQLLARVKRGSGVTPTVCFVNSFGGRLPLPDMTAYCASKYALQGFSDSLRLELSQKGVHVSTVHPGVIRSDFRERAQWRGEGNQRQKMMDNLLDGKAPFSGTVTQSVDEIADAVFDAVQRKQTEVVVGLPFQAALGAFGISKVLGIN